MNFLAHFQLAAPDEELVIGALEGDYLKGPLRGNLPAGIERGVKLHRAIDAFTDQHPLMAQLRRQFPMEVRRYCGILIDLSFDHFLSNHWQLFSSIPLQTFNTSVYRSLEAHKHHLGPGAQRMQSRMQQYDLLGMYGQWHTIGATAARIGERFSRHNPFLETEQHLEPMRASLEQAFLDFYPELVEFCGHKKLQLN
ncbi:MAG: ACP phosphodiesterase [Halioglobus sp.]